MTLADVNDDIRAYSKDHSGVEDSLGMGQGGSANVGV